MFIKIKYQISQKLFLKNQFKFKNIPKLISIFLGKINIKENHNKTPLIE